MKQDIDKLVNAIADQLMTNAFGDKATRLALKAPDTRPGNDEVDLGGWNREALVSQIKQVFASKVLNVYLQPETH